MTLWIVEKWDGQEWIPHGVWSSKSRETAFETVAGLVKNGGYRRRHLRVKAWVRAAQSSGKGGT